MSLFKKVLSTVFTITTILTVPVLAEEYKEDLYNQNTGVKVIYEDYLGTIEKATFNSTLIENGNRAKDKFVYPLKVVRYQKDRGYVSFENVIYDELSFYLASFYHYYDITNNTFTYSANQHADHLREFPIKMGKTKTIKSVYSSKFQTEANLSSSDLSNTPFIIDYYLVHTKDIIADSTELIGVSDESFNDEINNIHYKRISKPYAYEKTGFISLLVVPEDFEPTTENFADLGIIVNEFTPNVNISNTKTIADVNIFLDDVEKELVLPALNIENRIFYPLRETLELIDAKIQWDDKSKTAICTLDDNTIKFTVDSNTYIFNDEEFLIDDDVSVFLDKENMYVPIRIALESLGFDPVWDKDTNSINIVRIK